MHRFEIHVLRCSFVILAALGTLFPEDSSLLAVEEIPMVIGRCTETTRDVKV